MNIYFEISRLIHFGFKKGLLAKEDCIYASNRLLHLLSLSEMQFSEIEEDLSSAEEILENIVDWAAEKGLLEENTSLFRDLLDTEIMNCLMPRPSEISNKFYDLYKEEKSLATDYYYHLSKASNYIRVNRIVKDEKWFVDTEYGKMIITINLSKPEKDPKDIIRASQEVAKEYPKCALCIENEGFAGSVTQAARASHRLIPIKILEENWYLQYSPYVYYNEHCIVIHEKHLPMKISKQTFAQLLDFVGLFPHYFIGCNADLPIVGGSILSHEHFQGGRADFPMAKAEVSQNIVFEGFEDISAGLLHWSLSVLRLKGKNVKTLLDLAEKIFLKWKIYSDEASEILAFTGDIPHNTITPIARYQNGFYELDLVLRNNRSSEKHPLGIFHPHEEYHHIKKENIGLIEVMGLAILPARLQNEILKLEYYLQNPEKETEFLEDSEMSLHQAWYKNLKERNIKAENVKSEIQKDIGLIFSKILENAGVFKNTEEGQKAFVKFCDFANN